MIHSVLATGLLSSSDFALVLLRATLGLFFFLARFRWFYDPSRPQEPWLNKARRAHLQWKLCDCGYGSHPILSGLVAIVEVGASLLVIIGLATVPAAAALLCVLLFATYCTACQKVKEQSPVDCIDCVSCYLWRVEGVYIVVALSLIFAGPGRASLDWWL